MSLRSPQPRRTSLTLKIAYGQLVVAVGALALVPVYALRSVYWPPAPAAVVEETADIAAALALDGASAGAGAPAVVAANDPLARGEALFGQTCAGCHQATGAGLPGVFPPLAGSDYLLADADRAVGVVLHGLVGPVTVNGVDYQSAMPPMPLSDEEVAAVLSYVMQAWGNQGPAISPTDVARLRAAGPPGS